ncbi:MAG: 2-oxo acid dehydrogenase subunit E2, partial [Chthonomonadaceae bacterium]|nr:2-oxo acid dehydrogenase subunit E2 [Chthonomonadaceae bacterium]
MSVEIRVPQMGESIVEATLARWIKREGDPVSAGEPIAELETDKVNMEITADQAGVLEALRFREGDTVAVNDVIAILNTASNGSAPSDTPVEEPRPAVVKTDGVAETAEVRVSPVAARMARENDIDLSAVQGSGAGGKIVQRDVQAALQARSEGRKPKVAPTVEGPVESAPVVAERVSRIPDVLAPPAELREERVRMSRRRQTIAARLKEAQNTAAMLTTFNEIDMSAVIEIRKRRRDAFKERYGVSLGFMSFFTKACVGALKAFPYLNAEIQGN